MNGIECRIASLRAFIEARDRQLELPFSECGDDDRQTGGRFGPGNDCAGGAGAGSTAAGFPSSWGRQDRVSTSRNLPHGIGRLEVTNAKAAKSIAESMGVRNVADLLRVGAATAKGSEVTIEAKEAMRWTLDGEKRLRSVSIASESPIEGGGSATVEVTLRDFEGRPPYVYYDYFQVDDETRGQIRFEKTQSDGGLSPTERRVSAAIIDQMLESLAAADEAGIGDARTAAAGSPGDSTYKGYRLWGRFGFDGSITQSRTAGQNLLRAINAGSDHGLMTPEQEDRFRVKGSINLQELLSTKAGERWWSQNGEGMSMELDFSNKQSLGYKRFRDFLDKHRRAKKRAEPRDYLDFVDFVCRSSVSRDLEEWPGFRGVEQRSGCGKDDGGKFAKGNDCAGDGKAGGAKEKPLNANDPEAVKAFIAKMAKEAGLDIHGRPTPKGSPRPNVDPQSKPKSLHQQRLEAAGKWSSGAGADKHRDEQAKFQESVAYHDDIDPLKDLLRSSGIGWGAYANQANEFVRKSKGTPQQTTKKDFNRKAAQAASQGDESLAKFLDESGMSELARKLRAKREHRNCGTGGGGFQKGNTCAGQAVSDVAGGAAKGAVVGAATAVGNTGGFPPAVATGAATGAAIGAVKGLYDNRMRPTRAGKAIKAIGTTDEQVASMVKGLGGSPKSIAEADGKSAVTLSIKGKDGKSQFDVRMTKSEVRIKPVTGRQNLTAGDIKQIKKIAQDNSPKSVRVVVDAVPTSVLAKIVKAGASLAVDATGALVAAFVVPSAPAVVGTAIEATTGIEIEKTKAVQWVGEKVLGNLPKRR